EPVLVSADVAGHPIVGRGIEAHDLRRDVVDEGGPLDSLAVHQGEQLGGLRKRPLDLGEVAAARGHERANSRLHLLPGLYVDVAVEDAHGSSRSLAGCPSMDADVVAPTPRRLGKSGKFLAD